MICQVCNNEIPRGKRYKSPTHKSLKFCSEECYLQYVKDAKFLDKIKSILSEIYDEQLNYPFVMKQVKNIMDDYNVGYQDVYLMLKYAIQYENVVPDTEYGLQQFIKYLYSAIEFKNKIIANQELSRHLEEEKINYIKPTKQTERRSLREKIDFD